MKTLLLTTFSVLVLMIHSCGKNPKCWGSDKNKGDISGNVKITCKPIIGDRWVINDQTTYEQTFDYSCSTLPGIDFSSYTLLGLSVSGSCETKYIREVTRAADGAHYKVTVKSCGSCKKMSYSNNWVIIPKIPDNAVVTFEVKEK